MCWWATRRTFSWPWVLRPEAGGRGLIDKMDSFKEMIEGKEALPILPGFRHHIEEALSSIDTVGFLCCRTGSGLSCAQEIGVLDRIGGAMPCGRVAVRLLRGLRWKQLRFGCLRCPW